MTRGILLLLLALSGCAAHPQLVMLNPRTGARVDCEVPDPRNGSAGFLASRACLSACQAHGFRAVPNAAAGPGAGGTPAPCLD